MENWDTFNHDDDYNNNKHSKTEHVACTII